MTNPRVRIVLIQEKYKTPKKPAALDVRALVSAR